MKDKKQTEYIIPRVDLIQDVDARTVSISEGKKKSVRLRFLNISENSVTTLTRLRNGKSGARFLAKAGFISSPEYPDQQWGPFNMYVLFFPCR
jgi:16S rRNA U516 pseudouridylate synthase RsuA-like enzyme